MASLSPRELRQALQSAQALLQNEQYPEAINAFQRVCQHVPPNVSEHWDAQMSIVIAYKQMGQLSEATELAQVITTCSEPAAARWAKQFLEGLAALQQVEILPTPTELLQQADDALDRHDYPDAIYLLQQVCEQTEPTEPSYAQAQMQLVRAYKLNRQFPESIVLCRQLTTHSDLMIQGWAQQFLAGLVALQIDPPISVPPRKPTFDNTTDHESPFHLRSLEELQVFFRKNLLFHLSEYERKRKTIRLTIVICSLIFGIVLLGFLYFGIQVLILVFAAQPHGNPAISRKTFGTAQMLFIGLLIIGFFWFTFIRSAIETYRSGFKSKVIERLIKFLDPTGQFQYTPVTRIGLKPVIDDFVSSQLFGQLDWAYLSVEQEDCITGQIGKTDFTCSEIRMKQLQSGWEGIGRSDASSLANLLNEYSGSLDDRKLLFNGLFSRARFNKTLQGQTVILPDTFFTRTRALNFYRGQNVKLEDPEFERYYEVYATDQIEARYALSTNLMARLVDFRKKVGHELYISLLSDRIYILIPLRRDFLEPKLNEKMLTFKPIQEYYEDLRLMIDLVDDLKLNRRIWLE
jgi:Protein of unknown function (DUF3137)